jgi:hypothetical protein
MISRASLFLTSRFFKGVPMKALPMVGVLLLVLGFLSLIVPLPHRQGHGIRVGDAKISIQTESTEKLPSAVGIILIGGGVVALILGLRKA